MSLRYVFGGPGTGKTQYCLQELRQVAALNRDTAFSCLYIVPEQFTLETEKQLLALSTHTSLIKPQVLSFQRLAYRLFRENGLSNHIFLDDLGKNMLLRKTLLDLKDTLVYFGRAADKQGFIDGLCRMVSEFYQYGVQVEDLRVRSAQLQEEQSLLGDKLSDLSHIFAHYLQTIADKYITTDSALDLVPSRIPNSSLLSNAYVWVDGFHGFTTQEYRILSQIMCTAAEVTVVLPLTKDNLRYPQVYAYDFFAEMKTTVNKLTSLATENGVRIAAPVLQQEAFRYAQFPALGFLQKNYFQTKVNPTADNIFLSDAANMYAEVTQTATQILHVTRTMGYRYKDIGIVVGNVTDYEKAITQIFALYDIPVFIDRKRDILSHPLVEFVRGAVEIVATRWRYESVFRFLKTGLTPLSRDEVDKLENYVLAHGIHGHKWQMQRWLYEGADEVINEIRQKTVQLLAPMTQDTQKRNTVRHYAENIFALLQHLDVEGRLETWRLDMISTDAVSLATTHVQVWGLLCQVFDKLVEILGDTLVTPKDFLKIIEAGFVACDMGMIPSALDQVIIGDVSRSRLPRLQALFVLGANEGVLPKYVQEDNILADEERQVLQAMGMELAPDSKRKTIHEQFLMYATLMVPEQKLFVSHVRGNLAGKPMQPSSVVTRLQKMFSGIAPFDAADAITLPRPMFGEMGQLLRDYSVGKEIPLHSLQAYAWFAASPAYTHKLQTMEAILFYERASMYLSEKTTKRLYGRDIVTGISRVEQYVRCPFAYYVRHNLRANERKAYEVLPMDIGNLFHAVLEDFSQQMSQSGKNWSELDNASIDAIVEQIVTNITPQLGNAVLESSGKNQYMVHRIKRIAKKSIWALCEHMKRGLFTPLAAELAFEQKGALTGIAVHINAEQKFILTGRIDRVDVLDADGNLYVKIIDYKTGNVQFDLNDLYFGMQLQLLLYLDAFIKNARNMFPAEHMHAEILPGGVLYFNIDDPMLEVDGTITDAELTTCMLKSFRMTGVVLADENVVRAMDGDINGRSDIVPVGLLKDGGFDIRSAALDLEGFNNLREAVLGKIQEVGQQMVSGNIQPLPFKKMGARGATGCDYCSYAAICQIALTDEKERYNIVAQQNKKG